MDHQKLSQKEMRRYSRHMAIPEFGLEGQLKLKQAKVLVVGAGGLGCPLLLYLAAAGVGKIGIVDFDIVDESNLQRQVLYSESDVGQFKAEVAKEKIQSINSNIEVVVFKTKLTSENAISIINEFDVVADGTDNFPTRYLVNDACVIANKVNVFASIFRFEGQVSVFNFPNIDGSRGPNYRDLFPEPPPKNLVPNCAVGGVLGVLPGIIGSIQASEVLKVITGIGDPLAGRLFLFDVSSFTTRTLKINVNPDIKIDQLIDYDLFCGYDKDESPIQQISVWELKALKDGQGDFQLIDVRESFEHEMVNIGGTLIPLAEIEKSIDKIEKDKKIIVYCRSGQRSQTAIESLQKLIGFDNLYNLQGGILAYAKEIDQTLPTY